MDPAGLTWPEGRIPSAAVRAWIGTHFPAAEKVGGPTVVYRVADWAVTARFAVSGAVGRREVVFKAGFLPEDADSLVTYPLLRRACGDEYVGQVPELLAGEARPGTQTWLLFAPFEGPTLRSLGTLPPVAEMARLTARLQSRAASLISSGGDLPARVPVASVPALLSGLLRRVEAEMLCAGLISSADIMAFQGDVADWARELEASGVPESLDHPDLHTNNAALLADGRVLIFDWEGTTWSCPFFSLDNLLENAERFDRETERTPSPTSGLSYTACQHAVRNAYLDALPWGTPRQRERAFDVARCLAPVVRAHQYIALFDALKRDFLAAPGGGMEKHASVAGRLTEGLGRWREMRRGAGRA